MINKNTQIKGRMFLLKNKKPLTTKNALEVFEEKMENPKYCTKEIGRLLYSDKLLAVERFEKIDEVIRRYSDNKKHNKTILNELNTYKRQGIISNVLSIDKFLYSKEYLDFLNNLPKNRDDVYYMCNGLTDVGYVEFSNTIPFTTVLETLKSLQVDVESVEIMKPTYGANAQLAAIMTIKLKQKKARVDVIAKICSLEGVDIAEEI